MLVSKTVELKRIIAQIINEDKSEKFPQSITFSRGIEYPKYKITIEEIDEDFFVDSKGIKWIKSKDVDE
jgi:hypothetical protein